MMLLTNPDEVRNLGTILGVWAHPDDESFMMAGLMAAAVANGQEVACVTATKGEMGSQDEQRWPPASLGEVRARELANAFKIMGVKHHHWLDYPDGGCRPVNDGKAVDRILELFEVYQPDTVVTFPPDGLTGHPDHIAVSRWAKLALERKSSNARLLYGVDTAERYQRYLKPIDEKFDIYFNVDQPRLLPETECDVVLKLDAKLCRLKHRVLAAMPSQTAFMFETFGREHMEAALSTESFVYAGRKIKWGKPKT